MMRRPWMALLLLPLLAACDGLLGPDEETGPEVSGVCAASVRLNGIWYQESSTTVPAELVSPQVFGTALREVTCNDTFPLPEGAITEYQDGDVLGFPVGTTFHEVATWGPTARLAVDRQGTWVMLEAVVS